MTKRNRRTFLQTSTAALAALSPVRAALRRGVASESFASNFDTTQSAPTVSSNEGKKPLRLGLILGIGRDPNDASAKVHALGLPTFQVLVDEITSVLSGQIGRAHV